VTDQIQVVSSPLRHAELGQEWPNLAVFLVVGYLGLGKPFAYLGLPWISLYIGEMALMAFLLFGPMTKHGRWLGLVWRAQKLRRLKRLLLLSLFYGGFTMLRGILRGYPGLTAARDTAFNYYPLFLFLGIWVGLRDSRFFCQLVRILALWAGCYGLAYILFLNQVPWTMPGTDGRVPVFLGPYGASTVALLGLLTIEPRLKQVWHLIPLNLFVLLGVQVRAEWVGFAAGVLAFAWLTRKMMQLVLAASALVVLLGLMYATGLDLQTPTGRGESVGSRISAAYLVARGIAPLSKDLGEDLASAEDVSFAAGTAEWRLVWWANIWGEVHAHMSSLLFGFGYGYPVGDLNPDIEPGTFMQTPHNDCLYALVFSGWLGVMLFGLLQFEIVRLLWCSYRITGQPFGLMCWTAFLTMSLFEDFFEAPFAAIPSFLLLGAAITPILFASPQGQRKATREPLAGPEPTRA
jgi:O-antigen ligase/polysaccharide polymerase Wzy-like membrane protein